MNKKNYVLFYLLIFTTILCILGYYAINILWPYRSVKWPKINVNLPNPLFYRSFTVREWVHRVNSIERVRFSKKYIGMEIDATFNENLNYFDVGHPPSISIGLNLKNIISELNHTSNFYIWLDIKNLTDRNKHSALEELNYLSLNNNLQEKLIIESQNAEALSIFTDAGYYTSFYIPTQNINKMTKEELWIFILNLLDKVSKSRICAISSDQSLYEFVYQYFPNYDRLHWYPTENFIAYWIRSKKILKDPGVKVLLFHIPSEGYR